MSEVKSRKSGKSSVPAPAAAVDTKAEPAAEAHSSSHPSPAPLADWWSVPAWLKWLDDWDQQLTATPHPYVEFVFAKAGPQLKTAKRVHVYLGIFGVLSVLTILTLGLEFFSHFIAFVPPLIHTLHAIAHIRQRAGGQRTAAARDEYVFFLTYWILYASLTVFESFVFPGAHSHGGDDDDHDDEHGTGSFVFHLFHIVFLAWCHNPVHRGALVVYERAIVPVATKLSAALGLDAPTKND